MDQIDFDLLSRLEAGESVFRPAGQTDDARSVFAGSEQGAYLMVGPCDLTEAGRRALADDRRLGPRA